MGALLNPGVRKIQASTLCYYENEWRPFLYYKNISYKSAEKEKISDFYCLILQELREKYEQRVQALVDENNRLKESVQKPST